MDVCRGSVCLHSQTCTHASGADERPGTTSSTADTGTHSKYLGPSCGNRPGKPQKHLGSELSTCTRSHLLCIISHLVLSVLLLAQGWLSPSCTLLAKACAWEGEGRACRRSASKPQAVCSVLSPCTHAAEKTQVRGSGASPLLALPGLTAGETS